MRTIPLWRIDPTLFEKGILKRVAKIRPRLITSIFRRPPRKGRPPQMVFVVNTVRGRNRLIKIDESFAEMVLNNILQEFFKEQRVIKTEILTSPGRYYTQYDIRMRIEIKGDNINEDVLNILMYNMTIVIPVTYRYIVFYKGWKKELDIRIILIDLTYRWV